MPNKPVLTLDGYIRVSRVGGREGDSFISPDVQRDQIQTWARLRGVEIAAWHTDLDVSGGTLSRPGLNLMLQRVRDGHTGGVAVARLDRLSRASVADALNIVSDIHDAGGQIAAVDLGIDPTTPFGEFAMTLMLALARMERRRIADQWRISRQRAVERGVHVSSARPTGYQRTPDGRLEPHETEAREVQELFRRAVAGDSWADLARFLDDTGVEGPYGPVQWTGGAVAHIIKNRVYLGEARSGEFVNPDAHEALVDRRTWEAAQVARGPAPPRGEPALLAGLLRCAGCRHLLKPDRVTLGDGTRARTYRCRGEHSSGTCTDRSAVMGHIVETYVEQLVLEHVRERSATGQQDDEEYAAAQAAARAADDTLTKYRDDERILATLGADRYVEGLTRYARASDDAWALVAELHARRGGSAIDHAVFADVWPTLTVDERKRVLASMIDCVFLRSGRMLAIEDRVAVFWRGEGPDNLPSRGRRVQLAALPWPVDGPPDAGVPPAQDLEER
jgi:DNA invertase Pin-like site-specific DNA recombinase